MQIPVSSDSADAKTSAEKQRYSSAPSAQTGNRQQTAHRRQQIRQTMCFIFIPPKKLSGGIVCQSWEKYSGESGKSAENPPEGFRCGQCAQKNLLRAVGPEGAKPRVPVCFPGKLSQITKNEDRNVLKIAEKPIDKIGRMIYNRSPYCDTMPRYGFYPLHGHFTTERGGCQVPVVQHFAT